MFVPTATIVYGITIDDPYAAALTRRVLTVSVIMALLVVGVQIYNLASLANYSFASVVAPFISMLFGMCVPFCGYVGAKRKDRNLLCCFCGCNCVGASCYLFFTLSYGVFFLSVLDDLQRKCTDSGGDDGSLPEWAQDAKLTCSDIDAYNRHAAITAISIGAVSCILQCLGFCWGRELRSHPWVTTVRYEAFSAAPTFATYAQPAAANPAAAAYQPPPPQQHQRQPNPNRGEYYPQQQQGSNVPIATATPVAAGYGAAGESTYAVAKEVAPSGYGYQQV